MHTFNVYGNTNTETELEADRLQEEEWLKFEKLMLIWDVKDCPNYNVWCEKQKKEKEKEQIELW